VFQQLQKYESGTNRVSKVHLTRIGRALEVDVTYLLGAKKRATTTPAPSPKEQAEFAKAVEMLGQKGALRLLKAFANILRKAASASRKHRPACGVPWELNSPSPHRNLIY
jgi:hypothetical protein